MSEPQSTCETTISLPAGFTGSLVVGAVVLALRREKPIFGKALELTPCGYKDGQTYFWLRVGGPELSTQLEILLDNQLAMQFGQPYTIAVIRHRYFRRYIAGSMVPPELCIKHLQDFAQKFQHALEVVAAA